MEVCLLTMPTFVCVILIVIVAAVMFAAGIFYRKRVAEREIASAEDEAKRIINEAIKSAESKHDGGHNNDQNDTNKCGHSK